MVKNTEKKFFKLIVDTDALVKGHFYFTGDYHAQYYIDTEQIFQYPKYVEMVCKELYRHFSNKYVDYILTPNYRGGAILAHNLGESFNAKVMVLRRERGIISTYPPLEINGNILIVDDGINTAGSLNQILNILTAYDVSLVGIGVFINRYPGKLEGDLKNLVTSIINLNKEPYNLVPSSDCELCKRDFYLKKELLNTTDYYKKRELLYHIKELELKCAYGDIDI